MPVLSTIANSGLVWIAIAVVMMFFRKTRSSAIVLLFAMLLGLVIGEVVLKNVVCRVRPFYYTDIALLIPAPKSYSFPSGHTCSSFAAATVLMKMDKRFGVSALVLATLIGFSRLYNYVHFPTDVLCGALLGVFCGIFMCWLFKKYGWQDKIDNLGTKKT